MVSTEFIDWLRPLIVAAIGLSSSASVFFILLSGYRYMTSRGNPDGLVVAKSTLKNALIGLVVVIGSTLIMSTFTNSLDVTNRNSETLTYKLDEIEGEDGSGGVAGLAIGVMSGFLSDFISSLGRPFVEGLRDYSQNTPTVSNNENVFTLWLVVLGISNGLFLLGVILVGFRIMSAGSLGLHEVDLKQSMLRLAVIFILMNTSIYLIDSLIDIANKMNEIVTGSELRIWEVLLVKLKDVGNERIASLLMMVIFVATSLAMLVFYVIRIVKIFFGAVIAPLVLLCFVLPVLRDVSLSLIRAYVINIFLLFFHSIILILSSTLFDDLGEKDNGVLMPLILGIATLVLLLKSQGVINEVSIIRTGSRVIGRTGQMLYKGVRGNSSSKEVEQLG